jgi:4-diphosphocytidyl-2-C-methyl-D-erythritol kinase
VSRRKATPSEPSTRPNRNTSVRSTVVLDAPAKVNLFLRVLHRRDDGYHELETLLQAISLVDVVRVEIDEKDFGDLTLEVDGPDLGPVESNLAFQAAQHFREVSGFGGGVKISLQKRIPAGAGLGGGSSDAAAVLRCLSMLTGFEDREALNGVACGLGSDVPFFLRDTALALGTGRGERVTSLPSLPAGHLVLALPPVHVSTAAAYDTLSVSRAASGTEVEARASEAVAGETPRSGPHSFQHAFDPAIPLDWSAVASMAWNDFEPVVGSTHPEVRVSLEGLRDAGGSAVILSGSGAASFGLFSTRVRAEAAAEELFQRFGWPFLAVTTLIEMPSPSGT